VGIHNILCKQLKVLSLMDFLKFGYIHKLL